MKCVIHIEGNTVSGSLTSMNHGGVHIYSRPLPANIARKISELIKPEIDKAFKQVIEEAAKNVAEHWHII